MRTTITLDDDVAARLQRQVREQGVTFKEAVNSALRLGLETGAPPPRPSPYVAPSFHLGLRPGIDLTKANQLAAELEDVETVRKLALRK